MNHGEPWQTDWRDDAPFPDERRAEVMDETSVEQVEADLYRQWAQDAPKE